MGTFGFNFPIQRVLFPRWPVAVKEKLFIFQALQTVEMHERYPNAMLKPGQAVLEIY